MNDIFCAFLQQRKTEKSQKQHNERRGRDDGVASDHHGRLPVHRRPGELLVVSVTLGITVSVDVDVVVVATKKNELCSEDVADRQRKRLKPMGCSLSPGPSRYNLIILESKCCKLSYPDVKNIGLRHVEK